MNCLAVRQCYQMNRLAVRHNKEINRLAIRHSVKQINIIRICVIVRNVIILSYKYFIDFILKDFIFSVKDIVQVWV